jgi:hypothetical protein
MAPGATFRFKNKFNQIPNSVRKPATLAMRPVADASSYFHTDKFLQQHHYL